MYLLQVVFNFESIYRDEKIFPQPDKFDPGRYIEMSSSGEKRFKKKEESNIFGFGKRRCIGEALARAEQFIFFTKIFQEFRVISNDSQLAKGYIPGRILSPPKFSVRLKERID